MEQRSLAVIDGAGQRTIGHLKESPWNDRDIEVIKDTLCPGIDDANLKLFAHQCERLGLDPFTRQIYVIKRSGWEDNQRVDKFTIQVGIDGFRLVADRTGNYSPGEVTFAGAVKLGDRTYPDSATATVYKFVRGEWREVKATAYFAEYAQVKKDGTPTQMWASKPRVMLGKCAEVLALRKAFPAELSGVYAPEEMDQADNPPIVTEQPSGEPIGQRPSASGPATAAQVKAIYVIARNEGQLNEGGTDAWVVDRYGKNPAELSRAEASEIIDRMRVGDWKLAGPAVAQTAQVATVVEQPAEVVDAEPVKEFANDWSKKQIRDGFQAIDIHGNEQKEALKLWVGRTNVNGHNLTQDEADTLLGRLTAARMMVDHGIAYEDLHSDFANFIEREGAMLYNATSAEIDEVIEILRESAAEPDDGPGDRAEVEPETDPDSAP